MVGPSSPALILADANLLVKDVVSATFFDLNDAKLISLHWTPEIEAEYIEHRARLRAEQNGHETQLDDLIWAGKRIDIHKKYLVPNCFPSGWIAEETLAKMMVDPKYANLKNMRDKDDMHVVMAAAFMAEATKRSVVLATHNLPDFPQAILDPFNVLALHPGVILELLFQNEPKKIAKSLLKTCEGFIKPDIPPAMFLNSISATNQFNNPALAQLVKNEWSQIQTKSKQLDS